MGKTIGVIGAGTWEMELPRQRRPRISSDPAGCSREFFAKRI